MVAGVVAALLAGVGVSWVLTHRESVGSAAGGSGTGSTAGCLNPVEVRVATVTEYQAFVESLGRSFASTRGGGDGACAKVVVTSSPTLAPPAPTDVPPTVFIGSSPDLQDLRTKLASAALASPAPVVVGRTYTVVATPAADFAKNGWDAKTPSWAELSAAIVPPTGAPGTSVVMADPATSFASQRRWRP
ncbi:MAG: hypothetical protein WAW82_04515 [Candidatus Lutibacillus vidarii]